jgi:hypothetical protein
MFDLITTSGVYELAIGFVCFTTAFAIFRENRGRRLRPAAELVRPDEPRPSRFLSILSIVTAIVGTPLFATGVIKLLSL